MDNQKIVPNANGTTFKRYIVKRYDGRFYEVDRKTYDNIKRSSFFESLILIWYIRGTKDFVRNKNIDELERAEKRLKGVKGIIVNPLQFYIDDIG